MESTLPTLTLPAFLVLESAGTVLFDLPSRKICLCLYSKPSSTSQPTIEYLLPKGRRNVSERRSATALRETLEETGYTCKLLHIDMHTRQTLGEADEVDEVRFVRGVDEPFMVQVRETEEGRGRKLIWWFVGAVDHAKEKGQGEMQTEWVCYEDAVGKLTYRTDREVVREAVKIVARMYC